MIGRTVAIQGTMQRSGDEAASKQQLDNKSVTSQMNAANVVEKHVMEKTNDVVSKENAGGSNEKFDAKEKGKNEYLGTVIKKKKKKEEEDGKVTIKGNVSNFDMKI